MVWLLIGWKKYYETPVDESGAAVGPARLVREEPIYADLSPQELERYHALSDDQERQKFLEGVTTTTSKPPDYEPSVESLRDLTRELSDLATKIQVRSEGSRAHNRAAAETRVNAQDSSAEPTGRVTSNRAAGARPRTTSENRSTNGATGGAIKALGRLIRDRALRSGAEITASPEAETDAASADPDPFQSPFSCNVVATFDEFCKKANFNPPTPLAFDALRLFKDFEKEQQPQSPGKIQLALSGERRRLESTIAEHQWRLDAVKGKLGTLPWRALAISSSGLKRKRRKSRELLLLDELNVRGAAWTKLGQAKVSFDPDPIGKATRQKINQAARLLASDWSDKIRVEDQGVFSVYQDTEEGQTIIQFASGQAGSVFVTLPGLLDPTDVARQVLEAMRGALADGLNPSDPVVVLNGAFPEINMKEIISGRVVVRSRSDQAEPIMQRIGMLYDRAPLTPENTSILSAMPESAEDLARLGLDSADFDLWEALPQAYGQTIADRGFSPASTTHATASEFSRALRSKENVIVLVAHAESDCLYFPDGSQVRPADIEAMRDEIDRNKPVVYLFCCETAQYSMVESISQTLLRCGAAAVVAPQETIRPDLSRPLFSNFLALASGQPPITGLRDAENATGNYSMETWLG
ncbi:hypothetical protein ACFPFP_06900 [Bradyrhizobium sp. GCM10023182]|uniref:CHAT domain-containing protein n=2 Tax=Bradyrhizobium TaxID=374 RepID=A0ABS9LI36_9BRAD|nr:hypothetical protein [Bradyrhizobium zhengyangense]MCG2666662.1 hypothetical protein [Bradyrhizobium zhengyangense]